MPKVWIEVALNGAWGRERLATFKVPETFVFVPSLPLTSTGKVSKKELRDGSPAEQGTDSRGSP